MHITYAEYFLGIGSPGKGIKKVTKRHGDTCEFVYGFEIDKYARNSFCAIHDVDEDKIYHDITDQPKVLPYVDIVFYSPPCQSFSVIGSKEGTTVDKGNLFYAAVQGIKKSKPKYAIMENVSNLKTEFHNDFCNMLTELENEDYVNYSKVLNTREYGIPQNRQRIFIVSIRKDIYNKGQRFEFPNEVKLSKSVSDYVDFNTIVPRKILEGYGRKTSEDFRARFKTLKANDYFMALTTKSGYGAITQNYYTKDLKEHTLDEVLKNNIVVYANSPLMSFKLQGFDEEDYLKADKAYIDKWKRKSDSQMYKRAGNSITVNVEEELIENLIYQRKQLGNQLSIF